MSDEGKEKLIENSCRVAVDSCDGLWKSCRRNQCKRCSQQSDRDAAVWDRKSDRCAVRKRSSAGARSLGGHVCIGRRSFCSARNPEGNGKRFRERNPEGNGNRTRKRNPERNGNCTRKRNPEGNGNRARKRNPEGNGNCTRKRNSEGNGNRIRKRNQNRNGSSI